MGWGSLGIQSSERPFGKYLPLQIHYNFSHNNLAAHQQLHLFPHRGLTNCGLIIKSFRIFNAFQNVFIVMVRL